VVTSRTPSYLLDDVVMTAVASVVHGLLLPSTIRVTTVHGPSIPANLIVHITAT